MRGIIDRFEGGFAVVETENGFVNVPVSDQSGLREGDSVVIENGTVSCVDTDETENRKERINSLMKKLFK